MLKGILLITLVSFFISLDAFCQGNSDEIKSIGSYYIGFSNDRLTKNPFYYIGIKGQNNILPKSPVSLIIDANFIYGSNLYKEIYGWNLAAGLRIGTAYNEGSSIIKNIFLYFDIYSGISFIKDPSSDVLNLGTNSNLSIGFGYKYFGIELGVSKIFTDKINLNSEKLKIQFSYPYK